MTANEIAQRHAHRSALMGSALMRWLWRMAIAIRRNR
jgi:hypothetical protein